MIGGGGSFSAFVPFGRFPIGMSATEPFVCSGGLWTDFRRCGVVGLSNGI